MMRLVKIAVTLIGLVLAGISSLVFLLRGTALDYLAQSGVQYAGTRGVRVSYSSLSPHGIGAEVRGLDIWITKAFLGVNVDRLTASTAFGLNLLRATPETFLDGEMYGGTFRGTSAVSGTKTSGSFEMNKISLAKHPQIAGFGVRQGTLDMKVDSFEISEDKLSALKGSISLEGLETLPPILPLPIKVPAISNGKGSADFESDGKSSMISNLIFDTNIGKVAGEIRATVNPNTAQLSSGSGKLQISLTNEGSSFIGPYLPLISQNRLTATDQVFTVSFTSQRCRQPPPYGGNICFDAVYEPR